MSRKSGAELVSDSLKLVRDLGHAILPFAVIAAVTLMVSPVGHPAATVSRDTVERMVSLIEQIAGDIDPLKAEQASMNARLHSMNMRLMALEIEAGRVEE